MSNSRTFYRTLIEVEVLSEEPYIYRGLVELAQDVRTGGQSGLARVTLGNQTVDGPAMAKLLLNQGSDPGFFRLTPGGGDKDDIDTDEEIDLAG